MKRSPESLAILVARIENVVITQIIRVAGPTTTMNR